MDGRVSSWTMLELEHEHDDPAIDISCSELWLLLCNVLPSFVALANSIVSGGKFHVTSFHTNLLADLSNLNEWAQISRPTGLFPDGHDARYKATLMSVLDELESRFLPQTTREQLARSADWLSVPGLLGKQERTYRKLQSLVEALSKAQDLSESPISIMEGRVRLTSSKRDKRKQLLSRLNGAVQFLGSLHGAAAVEEPENLVFFHKYPSRGVRECVTTLFDRLQEHWKCCCQSNDSHTTRKTYLSLTAHRRFEVKPLTPSPKKTSSKFEILLPTPSKSVIWQGAEIVVDPRSPKNIEHEMVGKNLCAIVGIPARGYRLRFHVCCRNLWRLRPCIDNRYYQRVQKSKFVSLRELLKPGGGGGGGIRGFRFSEVKGEVRIVLSFIIATSFLHLYEGPWLQQVLSSDKICFMYSPGQDIQAVATKPYLLANCRSQEGGKIKEAGFEHSCRFPSITCLGKILLEIASGSIIDARELEGGIPDEVAVWTDYSNWVNQERSIEKAQNKFPELKQAISSCLETSRFPAHFNYQIPPTEAEVRQYVFEQVVVPLGRILSDGYQISLEDLRRHPDEEQAEPKRGLFDHHNDIDLEKKQSGDRWMKHLNNDVISIPDDLPDIDMEADGARVHVAVLDTGFQPPDAISENLDEERLSNMQSECFASGGDGSSLEGWRIDKDGHGTSVAQLVLDVAPFATVHVARVFERGDDLKNPEIARQVHERIVQAIDRATNDWKVDIIVMSFGFDERIDVIHDAFERASRVEKPPLFFAATRNDGAHKILAWPACRGDVLGISSTDGYGAWSSFNPVNEGSDPILYAIGEGLPVVVGYCEGRPMMQHVSGTSYANPVAAGLAAHLLGFVRSAAAVWPKNQALANDLRRREGMKEVLKEKMSVMHDSGVRSLIPWEFWKQAQQDLPRALNDLAQVARRA